jgi:hypothetical protein
LFSGVKRLNAHETTAIFVSSWRAWLVFAFALAAVWLVVTV